MRSDCDLHECADDELLASWTAEQDQQALACLVERHRPMVTTVCQRILRRSGDAEDAIQETFITLADRGATITGAVGGWLRVVATHCAMAHYRAQQRRRVRALPPQLAEPAEESQDTEIVDACVAELTEEERDLIIRIFYLGETQAAIAQANRQSRLQVHRRLQAILGRLRSLARDRGLRLAPAALALLLAAGNQAAAAEGTAAPGLLASQPKLLGAVACLLAVGVVAGVVAWREPTSGALAQQGLGSIATALPLAGGMQLGGGIPGRYPIAPVPIEALELAVVPRAAGGGLLPVGVNMSQGKFSSLVGSAQAQALRLHWRDGSETLGLLLLPPEGRDLLLRMTGGAADAVLMATGSVTDGVMAAWQVEQLLSGSSGATGPCYEKTLMACSDARPLTCTWVQTALPLVLPAVLRTDRPTLILGLAMTQMTDDERAAFFRRRPAGGHGDRIITTPAATVR